MSIIIGKVLSAMVIMVPVFLIGDLVMIVRFGFDFWQVLMIVAASVMMPMIAELIGIIVNLKFPKMDAKDDVEVVKQSISSLIAVFIGLGACAVMAGMIGGAFLTGMGAGVTMLLGVLIGFVVLGALLLYLKKFGVKDFEAITV